MTLSDRQYHVKGRLIAFVGDTPAVNLVGGFKEGVSLAMRKCRQCMATFDQIQSKVCSYCLEYVVDFLLILSIWKLNFC